MDVVQQRKGVLRPHFVTLTQSRNQLVFLASKECTSLVPILDSSGGS